MTEHSFLCGQYTLAERMHCSTLMECYITHLNYGLREAPVESEEAPSMLEMGLRSQADGEGPDGGCLDRLLPTPRTI